MSNFRDFLFDRDCSAAWTLALAMVASGWANGSCWSATTPPLFARLASKGGLTGQGGGGGG